MKSKTIYTVIDINCGVVDGISSYTMRERAFEVWEEKVKEQAPWLTEQGLRELDKHWSNKNCDHDIFIETHPLYE